VDDGFGDCEHKRIGSSGDHLFGLKGATSSGLLTLCYISYFISPFFSLVLSLFESAFKFLIFFE
jgi:hypothetical protein